MLVADVAPNIEQAPVKRGPGRPRKNPEYIRAKGGYEHDPARDPAAAKPAAPKLRFRPFAAIANQYARDVVDGRVVACEFARLSCARHLLDVEWSKADNPVFPWRFDDLKAAKVCARIEGFKHVKGKWSGQHIRLEPWQCFAVCVAFGWVHKDTGLRRFREVYLSVARKNAKSTLAAAIGNYMLTDDGENGAEVYAGATTEQQAGMVFGPAREFFIKDKVLRESLGLEVWAKSIVRPDDNSVFRPVIGKPGDGASPHLHIADEYHEHQTSDQIDTMLTGMGAREQPMLLVITTAGYDMAAPCYQMEQEAVQVLRGQTKREDFFCLIYALDLEDDWTDPANLVKANPNIGVSVSREYLDSRLREAMRSVTKQNAFRTKNLNQWAGALVGAINVEDWKRAEDKTLRRDQFKDVASDKALDLASKLDICAHVDCFTRVVGGQPHYYVFGRYMIPEDLLEEPGPNRDAYRQWVRDGYLITTEGAEIDFSVIREQVLQDKSEFQIAEIAYDPWRATHISHELAKDGAKCVEIGQGPAHMASPFDELLAALKSGRFHHDGNPVLAWMASNVVARPAAKGVVVPSKDKNSPTKKIDGIVAICMAIGRSLARNSRGSAFQVLVL